MTDTVIILTPEQVQNRHVGIRLLAEFCDGARSRDGSGFGKFDVKFGKSLAAAAAGGNGLSPGQLNWAGVLCLKYQGQLRHLIPDVQSGIGPCRLKDGRIINEG